MAFGFSVGQLLYAWSGTILQNKLLSSMGWTPHMKGSLPGMFYSPDVPPRAALPRRIPLCGRRRTTRRNHPARAILRVSRTESAHEIDDEANQQDQAKPAAADDGPAKVKPAAAKQEEQNNHE